jgi:hypothetical protein
MTSPNNWLAMALVIVSRERSAGTRNTVVAWVDLNNLSQLATMEDVTGIKINVQPEHS